MSHDDAPTSEPETSPRHDAPPTTNLADADAPADTDADDGSVVAAIDVKEESGKAIRVMGEIPQFLGDFEVNANEKYNHIVSLFEKFQDLSHEGREDEKAATEEVQSAMTKVKMATRRRRCVLMSCGCPRDERRHPSRACLLLRALLLLLVLLLLICASHWYRCQDHI